MQEKARREKERRSDVTNPFYQLLFSNEISRRVAVDKDGVIVYQPSIGNSVIHIVNSLASFLAAYIMVWLFYQLVVLITASFYEIDSILFYYKLDFNDHSSLWDILNIIIITISGPINSLILGFVFYNYLFIKAKSYPRLQLFYLWSGLLFFGHFFGAFISGVITNKGFGFVPLWLYWSDFTKFFFALVALVVLGLIGYYSASRFLSTTNNAFRIQRNNRALFYFTQGFMPFLLGFLTISLLKIPNNYAYDSLIIAFSAVMLIAVFFNTNAPALPQLQHRKDGNTLNWVLVLLTGLILYSYRFYLAEGLHFVIRLSVNITRTGGEM